MEATVAAFNECCLSVVNPKFWGMLSVVWRLDLLQASGSATRRQTRRLLMETAAVCSFFCCSSSCFDSYSFVTVSWSVLQLDRLYWGYDWYVYVWPFLFCSILFLCLLICLIIFKKILEKMCWLIRCHTVSTGCLVSQRMSVMLAKQCLLRLFGTCCYYYYYKCTDYSDTAIKQQQQQSLTLLLLLMPNNIFTTSNSSSCDSLILVIIALS